MIRRARWPIALSLAAMLTTGVLAIAVLSLWPQAGERIDPSQRPIAYAVQEMLLSHQQAWDSSEFEKAIPFTFLRLERSGCYGPCPIYTVTFYRDGRAELDGKEFIETKGHFTGSIELHQFARIAQMVDYAKPSIEEGYYPLVPDTEVIELTVGQASGEHRVIGSLRTIPPDLWATVQVLDALRMQTQWTSR